MDILFSILATGLPKKDENKTLEKNILNYCYLFPYIFDSLQPYTFFVKSLSKSFKNLAISTFLKKVCSSRMFRSHLLEIQ